MKIVHLEAGCPFYFIFTLHTPAGMKVYSISKWAFYGICLLIIALPLSREWKLLARGEKSTGTVVAYRMVLHKPRFGEQELVYVSEVRFRAGDSTYITQGPFEFEYTMGRSVPVRYEPDDPTHNCLVTFSALYLTYYTVLPVILLMLWGAFYLSFNNYVKRSGKAKSHLPASSPYTRAGGRPSKKESGGGKKLFPPGGWTK
jgi:hypothetical protein